LVEKLYQNLLQEDHEGVIRQWWMVKEGRREEEKIGRYARYVVGRQQRMGHTGLRVESVGNVTNVQGVR